ncbi:MAG: mechanosensitive ion channel [Candidatus Gracilibacteria bacterium]|nr:mechanosensitive ion channel [Candidatus Gracilibacteria bacterium]
MKKILRLINISLKSIFIFAGIFIYNITVFAADSRDSSKSSSILSNFGSEIIKNVFLAVFVIVLAFVLAKFFSSKVTKYMDNKYTGGETGKLEMIGVASKVINGTILFTGFLIALSVLGLDISIFLGGLGFGIGFTLKIFLTNFISGILMVTQGTYHNGDLIEIGNVTGNIQRIYSLYTSVKKYDGIIVYIPNVKFLQENVSNYHTNERRRINIEIGIDYSSDVVKAKNIMRQVVDQFTNVLKEPEPIITVDKLDNGSINLVLRFWILSKNGKYLRTKSNVTETINLAFKQSGIIIPFPQITLSNRVDFMQNNK